MEKIGFLWQRIPQGTTSSAKRPFFRICDGLGTLEKECHIQKNREVGVTRLSVALFEIFHATRYAQQSIESARQIQDMTALGKCYRCPGSVSWLR